jgi:ankyrin repeat protein
MSYRITNRPVLCGLVALCLFANICCKRQAISHLFEESSKLVFNNDVDGLKQLFSIHPELPSLRDPFDESTLLFVACSFPGTDNALDFLLNHGADVNAVDSSGSTSLHRHIKNNNISLETIEKLLRHGADPRIKNNSGQTPSDLINPANPSAAQIKSMLKQKK